MSEDKRKTFCPEHGTSYRCREGDYIICCGSGCEFKVELRREEDWKIPTRDDWN